MQHQDALDLLGHARLDARGPSRWADLGAGSGTFTRALAERLAPGSTIHALDRRRRTLASLAGVHHGVRIETHHADFTAWPWPFGSVDGILMANALHYVRDQPSFIRRASAAMSPPGAFLIVEYDSDRSNVWVPYPVSRAALVDVFAPAGFTGVETLGTRPSAYRTAHLYAALVTR